MTRTPLPLRADDLSVFARNLARQLGDVSPSHQTLMNMLARSAGHQNLQHMRATHAAGRRMGARADEHPADPRAVEGALAQFDAGGRLGRWPSRQSVQTLALWTLWSRLPARRAMPEREVNERLRGDHRFDDPATLRRMMIGCGLLTRRADGTDYRRVEAPPPPEAKALIRALGPRWAARSSDRTERVGG